MICNIKNIVIVILLLVVFCFYNKTSFAQKTEEINNLSAGKSFNCEIPPERKVINFLMNDNIKSAREILDEWEENQPDDIKIPFYRATVIFALAEFAQDDKIKKKELRRLIKTLKRGIKKAEAILKENGDDKNTKLALALSQALTGLASIRLGKYIQAYNFGRAGRDSLRLLQEEDKNLWDAYHILGVFEYYTGSVPPMLKWLTFILDLSGDVQKGVSFLETSVKNAPTLGPESARFLISGVYSYDTKIFCRYAPLSKQMRSLYPRNKTFSDIVQRIYRNCGYPGYALKEVEFARRNYLEKDPELEPLLDRMELSIRRDLKDREWFKTNQSLLKDSDIRQLRMAQLYDLTEERPKAIELYKKLKKKRTEPWIKKRARELLKKPYRAPVKIEGDGTIKLAPVCP